MCAARLSIRWSFVKALTSAEYVVVESCTRAEASAMVFLWWSEHSHCAIECTHCFMDVILGLFFNSVFARSVSVLPLTRAWTVVFFQNQVIHTLSYHNKQLPPLSIYWECSKSATLLSQLCECLFSVLVRRQQTENWQHIPATEAILRPFPILVQQLINVIDTYLATKTEFVCKQIK